jgi:hypothetical protein
MDPILGGFILLVIGLIYLIPLRGGKLGSTLSNTLFLRTILGKHYPLFINRLIGILMTIMGLSLLFKYF